MQLKYFFIIIGLFLSLSVFSQELTEKQQDDVIVFLQSVEKYKAESNKNQTANYLKKIADIYNGANMLSDALPYYVEASQISQEIGNTTAVRVFNQQIGRLYNEVGNFVEAEKYLKASLDIAYKSNNREMIASALSNYSSTLYNQKKYEEATENYEEVLSIAQELKNYRMMCNASSKIATCYKELGDEDNYEKYFRLTSSFNDFEKNEIIKEKEIAAEYQKRVAVAKTYSLKIQGLKLELVEDSLVQTEKEIKQNEIEIELLNQREAAEKSKVKEKEAKLKEKEAELRAKKTIIYSLIGGFVLILLASMVVLKLFIDKKKANKKLEVLNKELSDKNIKIDNQYKKLQTQNIKIENQNTELQSKNIKIEADRLELEKQNNQIIESINYASRIQKAILPSRQAILSDFKDAFIFYLPRDIVSGDFYWYAKHGDYKFVAAVDCTGHSVPGAFMSMIGNTLLNKIINEEKEFDPATVLLRLDKGIITTLSNHTNTTQTDSIENVLEQAPADGMDMTLCRFNIEKKEAVIAAANHQVIVMKNGNLEIVSGEYFSIGGHIPHVGEAKFKNNIVEIEQGTTFYMYSDGFPDQMGGTKKRKFMTKNFKKLLKSSQHLDMNEQKEELQKNFSEWKGNNRQIDDVLVIGVRF